MRNSILLICTIILVSGCTHLADRGIEKDNLSPASPPQSYYSRLESLLGEYRLNVLPEPSKHDINLIKLEKGGAGVLFGATMDDVVNVWGNPSTLWVEERDDVWNLVIGACNFGFINNSLVHIGIHRATLETAHFGNGISFKSSMEDVLSAFGEPTEMDNSSCKFVNENGYVVYFGFIPGSVTGKLRLFEISIFHPDAAKLASNY